MENEEVEVHETLEVEEGQTDPVKVTYANGVRNYIPGTKIVSREFRARFPDLLKEDEK